MGSLLEINMRKKLMYQEKIQLRTYLDMAHVSPRAQYHVAKLTITN